MKLLGHDLNIVLISKFEIKTLCRKIRYWKNKVFGFFWGYPVYLLHRFQNIRGHTTLMTVTFWLMHNDCQRGFDLTNKSVSRHLNQQKTVWKLSLPSINEPTFGKVASLISLCSSSLSLVNCSVHNNPQSCPTSASSLSSLWCCALLSVRLVVSILVFWRHKHNFFFFFKSI